MINDIDIQDCQINELDDFEKFQYIRKLRRKVVLEEDFNTNFEKNDERCLNIKNCRQCKQCKSVSIDLISNDNIDLIANDYIVKFNVAPNYKKYALVFECIKEDCQIESSPSKDNEFHHSLFKNDTFSINNSLISTRIITINNLQDEF